MSKEAMKLALEALENAQANVGEWWPEAIAAIREALAEQPAVSAGPITPAMMQGPTPEQKSQMVAAMSKLAEPPAPVQQEPVAWMHPDGRVWTFGRGLDKSTFTIPLYTSPPASKPWVGLTDVEIASACKKNGGAEWWWRDIEEYNRSIEAKLKEKNT